MPAVQFTDDELQDLCDARTNDCTVRDEAEARIKDYSVQIGTELALRGTDKIETPRYKIAMIDSERKTLSRQKLLELGVSVDVLVKAETVTASSSLRVTRRGGW